MNPKIAHYALASGLAVLVPIPFLDGWLQRKAHRGLYAAVAAEGGVTLDDAALDALAEDRSSMVWGCLGAVVLWPIKKLFRTVLYFLTIKDVVDGAAEAAVRAAMLRAALHRAHGDARGVRTLMDATLDRWQFSPISRFFLRRERPEAEWVSSQGATSRTVGWLYEKAGGGAILADFAGRLAHVAAEREGNPAPSARSADEAPSSPTLAPTGTPEPS